MRYEEFITRNTGIIKDQDCLKDATVSIAGCGAGGGEVAITLARMGIGRLILSDPEEFEPSNLNRQLATCPTIGRNKAEAVGAMVKEISPFCEVEVVPGGIDENNVERFMSGADIVLEEIEYREPKAIVLTHRTARKLKIPVLTGVPVAWSGLLFYFEPDGMTFEEYIGLSPETPIEEFDDYVYPLHAYCPELPLYMGQELLRDIFSRKVVAPSVAPACKLAAGLLGAFVYFFLSGEKSIIPIPHYYSTEDMFLIEPRLNVHLTAGTGAGALRG